MFWIGVFVGIGIVVIAAVACVIVAKGLTYKYKHSKNGSRIPSGKYND